MPLSIICTIQTCKVQLYFHCDKNNSGQPLLFVILRTDINEKYAQNTFYNRDITYETIHQDPIGKQAYTYIWKVTTPGSRKLNKVICESSCSNFDWLLCNALFASSKGYISLLCYVARDHFIKPKSILSLLVFSFNNLNIATIICLINFQHCCQLKKKIHHDMFDLFTEIFHHSEFCFLHILLIWLFHTIRAPHCNSHLTAWAQAFPHHV